MKHLCHHHRCPEPATTIILTGCWECDWITEAYWCTHHHNQQTLSAYCSCGHDLLMYVWHRGNTYWVTA